MNRFKILAFNRVGFNALVMIQRASDIANQIFNKFGIIVSALGDKFFVHAF